ncbi:MAG: CocE/NonD family hydrolase [Pseudomonadales bacterium]
MVRMRDGVQLETDVWKPGKGRYPVVLSRGYSTEYRDLHKRFTRAGYIYVGQSARGHGRSEGSLEKDRRFFPDGKDGYDTIEWIVKQPWCDGNVVMYGRSFWGATQWLAAREQHPNLRAILPAAISADFWDCVYRCKGAITLAMTAHGRAFTREQGERYGWQRALRYLPLIDLDIAVGGRRDPLWNDYITHSSFDDYWREISITDFSRIRIPVFLFAGWNDYYPGAAFRDFNNLRQAGTSAEVRILVSNSNHYGDPDTEFEWAIRWLDSLLRGKDTGIQEEAPIQIYVKGVERWRGEYEWPLARTKFARYYLRSEDGRRNGRLERSPPDSEAPIRYTYDPNDPTPTISGSHSFLVDIPGLISTGPQDHRPNEGRNDVLVFSTEPLLEDTEITGPVVMKLYAASDALDTDFIVKLLDVHPGGEAMNLSEGIVRARFREDSHGRPRLLEPGKIYEYTIELLPTANVFRKGHQIRIHLSSSSWPLWDRNPNTGSPIGMDAEVRIANQTVYHDRERPSHIVLPVIP